MTKSKKKYHSEQYFGDQRDFWWHRDFLGLMAKRWKWQEVKSILMWAVVKAIGD